MIGVAGPAASTLNGLLVLLKWTELMCEPNGTYGTHAGLAPNKQTVERIRCRTAQQRGHRAMNALWTDYPLRPTATVEKADLLRILVPIALDLRCHLAHACRLGLRCESLVDRERPVHAFSSPVDIQSAMQRE
jgi:hypothetical protein